jgi:hypothetical protein
MEQHPIPRQITTFEFKLIGFMTLKQFLYLITSGAAAFVFFKLIPIPIMNLLVASLIVILGIALAFLPVNDRPLDVWLRNLYKRLLSPTQYTYKKENATLYFLQDLFFLGDPHRVLSHVETKAKLAEYLQKTQPKPAAPAKKDHINTLLQKPTSQLRPAQPATVQTMPPAAKPMTVVPSVKPVVPPPQTPPKTITYSSGAQAPAQPQQTITYTPAPPALQKPFLTGIIRNTRQIPLPGILVYIKDLSNKPIRLLKTNPHGVFATYNAVPPGIYTFDLKDPNGGYFFDTMKISIDQKNDKSYEFYSKELL